MPDELIIGVIVAGFGVTLAAIIAANGAIWHRLGTFAERLTAVETTLKIKGLDKP